MSRRLHRCLTCEPDTTSKFPRIQGYTRHDDRVCATCRSRGVSVTDGVIHGKVHAWPADFTGSHVPIDLTWPSHSPDECFPGCTEHYPGRYA